MERVIRKVSPSATVLPKKKRIAAYARVSSGKDAMLHSLSAQVSYYSSYIQKHREWQYTGVYADEALTGTKDDRADFQRLLTDCRAGLIDLVITKSISRFARNTVTMLETVRELKNLNVDVFFEKESIHSISGDGELMLTILASFAQEESLSVSENCKWRMRDKFKKGIPNTLEVYGYTISKARFEIVPNEAETVRLIFSEYLSGKGRLAIAKELNALGIKTRNNKEWTGDKVREILRNEKYAGDLLLQKKYIADHLDKKTRKNDGRLPKYYVKENHKAIIDRETFNRTQKEFQRRSTNYESRPTTNKYPLTGKIRCGLCGSLYQRKLNNAGTKYQKAVWICPTYNQFGKDKCAAKQIPEDILIAAICEVLNSDEFEQNAFEKEIKEIHISQPNLLLFIQHNGQTLQKEWKYKSRSESWDEASRQRAREREIKKRREL